MELGIFTFVENTPDPETGISKPPVERMSNLMEEIRLADEAGLDVFGIGEHHRPEYLASAPAVILGAAAAITKQIKLTSTVTVLGSDDPVRVYQQFATVDLLSRGRAEIMVGRGSFIESFPLFGYDLSNYEELFEEKLQLLLQIQEENPVTWEGTFRPSIEKRGVYPRSFQHKMPIWRAVGGTPKSAYMTGALGLPMALAIIGGNPKNFRQFVDIHQQAAAQKGYQNPGVSINSHGFIADSAREAKDTAFPAFKQVMDNLGRERGWPPMSREQFEASCGLEGANFIGSPNQIIEKILYQHEVFGHTRFMLQMTVGSIPHAKVMKSIELFATKIAPVIRKETRQNPVSMD